MNLAKLQGGVRQLSSVECTSGFEHLVKDILCYILEESIENLKDSECGNDATEEATPITTDGMLNGSIAYLDNVGDSVQDAIEDIKVNIEIIETLKRDAAADKETIADLEKVIEDSNTALAAQVKLYHKEVNQLIGVKEHLENQVDEKHEQYFELKESYNQICEINKSNCNKYRELTKINIEYKKYYSLPWYKRLFTKKPF